jgi:hypothetical protein
MKEEKYTEEELYKMLWEKAEKIEKVPGAREINSDPELPSYEVFTDCFGSFRKSIRLKNLVAKFSELHMKNKCYCHDCCDQDEKKCEKDVLDCKAELTDYEQWLYFELFDKIIC